VAVGGALIVWFLFWALAGGGIGYAIGQSKGLGGTGFILGLLLGFIGWIIVAVMEPSEEVRLARQAQTIALAASVGSAGGGFQRTHARELIPANERVCPWCAESIKAAARVCRYCGRDIEPLPPGSELELEEAESASDSWLLDAIRDEYPDQFGEAKQRLEQLSPQPNRPPAWVRELCKRLAAGSPADAAVARIPLDWDGPIPAPVVPEVMPTVVSTGDPNHAGDFGIVRTRHPLSYDKGRSLLAGLTESPTDPEAWLEELCQRIDQGSPPAAAAGRIPLNWQPRS